MKNSADQGGCYPQRPRPQWITPSEICRIPHILRKPNSIVALLFIQNISPFLKEFRHFALCFSVHQNNTTLSPGLLRQRFINLQQAALLTSFWRHRFNNLQQVAIITSLVQYFGQQLVIVVNYACGFNQSKTEKYFQWIIINTTYCGDCKVGKHSIGSADQCCIS